MKKAIYNIYCDESCHLLNDHNKIFALGAIWIDKDKVSKVSRKLRDLKTKHGLSPDFEAKWTKVSKSKVEYYCDVVNYFFKTSHLHFRGVIVPNKGVLDHSAFHQDHGTWYYKMFFILLDNIIERQQNAEFHLYLDIKDTRSNIKVVELKRILNIASIEDITVSRAQHVRSHEVELVQLADLLIGALGYNHRGLTTNEGKNEVIRLIEESIGKKMLSSSDKDEPKFNTLVWKPKKITNK